MKKIVAIIVTISLLLSVILVAVGGEATNVEESDIEVSIIEPEDGEEFQGGDDVQIEFKVNNPEDREIKISLLIENDERIVNETWEGDDIKNDDSYQGNYTWETEDEGDYDIKVAVDGLYLTVRYDEDSVAISVEEEEEEEDDDEEQIPGFTTTLLLLALVIAVAVYRKKREV